MFEDGAIRYLGDSKAALCAYCPVHGFRCRKTRTVNAGNRRGQGRPLGYLAAWLMHARRFPDQTAHAMRDASFTLAERQEARARLHGTVGTASLFHKERPRAVDEASEPESFQ